MKNKKMVILIAIVILLVLCLIPKKNQLKDGGSIEYNAILYTVTDVHSLNEASETGYDEGITVDILGFRVFNNVK